MAATAAARWREALPLGLALGLFVLSMALVRPWGEFPLNDDWTFAHLAKQLAETGELRVDVAVAPAFVGQAVAGAGLIRAVGFSHLGLRLLTVALAAGLLAILHGILRQARVPAGPAALVLALVVSNPLFLHVAFSFMTEVYGLVHAFSGALLWVWARRRGYPAAAALGAFAMGSAFWTRQLCVLVFPALLGAQLLLALRDSGRAGIRPALRGALGPCVAFLVPIALYFPWSAATGNLQPAFFDKLVRNLTLTWIVEAFVHVGIAILYLGAFFAPLLLAFAGHRRGVRPRLSGPLLGAWAALLLSAVVYAYAVGTDPYRAFARLNRFFPLLPNVIAPYGVGPLTLSDQFTDPAATLPSYPRLLWRLLYAAIIGVGFSAMFFVGWARSVLTAGADRTAQEVCVAGILLVVGTSFATGLLAQPEVFDRYLLPALLGATLALGVMLAAAAGAGGGPRWRWAAAAGLLLPLWGFSVSGAHDYFRWNEARADLVRAARVRGIAAGRIDAGYERNGWGIAEEGVSDDGCDPLYNYFCVFRPYAITFTAEGAEVLDARRVPSWIGGFPDLLLVRRR